MSTTIVVWCRASVLRVSEVDDLGRRLALARFELHAAAKLTVALVASGADADIAVATLERHNGDLHATVPVHSRQDEDGAAWIARLLHELRDGFIGVRNVRAKHAALPGVDVSISGDFPALRK